MLTKTLRGIYKILLPAARLQVKRKHYAEHWPPTRFHVHRNHLSIQNNANGYREWSRFAAKNLAEASTVLLCCIGKVFMYSCPLVTVSNVYLAEMLVMR